ncbi:hypothetical protein A2U01_0002921 [Trifolium medium]|uniref:Uncharacterized protein n=1 Tax=Trifolium medium TaxID=97028 RepID=A0A392M7G2_9FABA|nr:hypothetical protein [Trifolium medium]
MLRKVVDGQIIIPDEYKQMEMKEEEEEVEEEGDAVDGREEGNQEGFEEGQGECDVRGAKIPGRARRSVPSPLLEPPIASWALSQGTATLEPVIGAHSVVKACLPILSRLTLP